jgi:WD40 repeat protein
LHTLNGHCSCENAVAITKDGLAVSGSYNGTLRVWDLSLGECLRTLDGRDRVTAVAVTADGRAVSGSGDGTIQVWHLATGDCQLTLPGQTAEVKALAVTAGNRLLSIRGGGPLEVRSLNSGELVATYRTSPPPGGVKIIAENTFAVFSYCEASRVEILDLCEDSGTLNHEPVKREVS